MEERIPAIAYWLGSHAAVFFALATVVAFAMVSTVWFVLVRRSITLPGWVAGIAQRLAALGKAVASHWWVQRWTWIAVYLSTYIVVAFATSVLGIVLFVELADEIRAGEDVAAFDDAFVAGLRASTGEATLRAFSYITRLGDPAVLIAVAAAVTLVLMWRRQRILAAFWIVATAGNALLTRVLKSIFERTRPLHEHGLIAPEGWSFPSGHASGSLAVYAMLAYVVLRGRDLQWWHAPLLVMTTAAILAVGFSRVFLQVHYPSDVFGGYLVAGSWLCTCVAGAELANPHLRRLRSARR